MFPLHAHIPMLLRRPHFPRAQYITCWNYRTTIFLSLEFPSVTETPPGVCWSPRRTKFHRSAQRSLGSSIHLCGTKAPNIILQTHPHLCFSRKLLLPPRSRNRYMFHLGSNTFKQSIQKHPAIYFRGKMVFWKRWLSQNNTHPHVYRYKDTFGVWDLYWILEQWEKKVEEIWRKVSRIVDVYPFLDWCV